MKTASMKNRSILKRAAFIALSAALGGPALAQTTSTWSGLGTTNVWNNPGNWQNAAPPISTNSTAVILTGTAQTTNVHNQGSLALNSLTFAAEAGAFTVNHSGGDFFTFLATPAGVLPHIDQFSSANHAINFPSTGFILNTNVLLGGTGSGSLSITGALQGAGRLVLNGPYTVTLNPGLSSSTYAGARLNAGTLRIAAENLLGTGNLEFDGGALGLLASLNINRNIVVNAGGGTIDGNGFNISLPGTGISVSGPGGLTLANTSATPNSASVFAPLNQGGGLSVEGGINVALSGTNTYSGGTNISGGATLAIDSDARLGNFTGNITLDAGTIRFTNGLVSIRRITVGAAGGTMENSSGVPPVIWGGIISGSGALTKTGTGRVRLGAINGYTGATNIAAGTIEIDNNQALQISTVNLTGGSIAFLPTAPNPILGGLTGSSNLSLGNLSSLTIGLNNQSTTFSGNINGGVPFGLKKIGTGVLTLLGRTEFTGPLNIEAGTLIPRGRLGTDIPITIGPGAILDLAGNAFEPAGAMSTFRGDVQLQTGMIAPAFAATVVYDGASVSNGFLGGAGLHNIVGNTTFSNLTIFNGAQLHHNGGTFFLRNSNSAATMNVNGGTLSWNNGSLTSGGILNVNNAASVSNFTSAGRINIPGGATPALLTNASSPLVLGAGSTTYIGTPTAPGGAVNLNGHSIELHSALLSNNGTISNGATNVHYGSLAKGAGTYGAINVFDGGKFSPGNSPGTVNTGTTTWGEGAGYLWEINDAAGVAGTNWDLWNINGSLNITSGSTANSRFTVSIASLTAGNAPGNAANFNNTQNYSWLIASANAGINGFDTARFTLDASTFTNPIGAGSFSLSQNGNNLFLNFNGGVAGPPQWNVDQDGSWNVAGNWNPATVPNSPTTSANFLGKITAPRTVTLDGDKTVGSINFDNANAYIISSTPGAGILTIGNGTTGTINVASGAHTISAPLAIAGDVIKTGTGTIIVSGPQSHPAGARLTVNAGRLNLNSNAGQTLALRIVEQGRVALGADQDLRELVMTISDLGPQQLDLNTPAVPGAFRALRVHAADLASAKASLYSLIRNAAFNPADGIYDSGLSTHQSSAIGLARLGSFILIRPTRRGDLNLDGSVTIADFIDLASNFNGSGTWQEGDLNYDGQITIADFIDLAANFNSSYSGQTWAISDEHQAMLSSFAAAHGVAVPEPAALGILLAAGVTVLRRRRR